MFPYHEVKKSKEIQSLIYYKIQNNKIFFMVFDLKNLTYKIDRIPFNTFEVSKKKKLNNVCINKVKNKKIKILKNKVKNKKIKIFYLIS